MSTQLSAPTDPWLTSEEAATLMRVSVATVLRGAKAGTLPCRLVGKQYRFVPAELDAATRPAPTKHSPATGAGDDWTAGLAGLRYDAA